MPLWMLTIILFFFMLTMFSPLPMLGRKCLYCGKRRPLLNWLCSIEKDYCDDCLDKMNDEIRQKRTRS